jgi:aminotransferase EvaB
MIKFWDYLDEYKKYRNQINKLLNKTILSGELILGKEVYNFEKKFSKFVDCKYGVGVGNGTDAIFLAIKALGIETGDEIITVSNTAIPTVAAIVNAGAVPVFVDIDENYLIDCKKILPAISKKTKAILVVHLYGQCCNMQEIIKIKNKFNLKIIEDCAQSTGATFKNNKSGGMGDVGCFSFYPTKVLGGFGDGGFVSTNNYEIYKKICRMRFTGIKFYPKLNNRYPKYYAIENGINSRLDSVQAAILNFKLNLLNSFIKRRKEIAEIYNNELSCTGLYLPKESKNNQHVYYEYVVASDKRNKILSYLKKKNIFLKVTYPYLIHLMKPYFKFYNKNKQDLSSTVYFSKRIFSLPIYPSIRNKNVYKIIKEIKKIL